MTISESLEASGNFTGRQCKETLAFLLGLLSDQEYRSAIKPVDVRAAVVDAVAHGRQVAS
jgi:hypothetical protein